MPAVNTSAPSRSPDPFGLPGHVVLSWTMAGAVAAGGFLSAGLALTRGSSPLSLTTVLLLAAVGALLGLVHGSLLAVLGRPPGESPRQSVHHLVAGAIWVIPQFAAAGMVALLIAVGPRALSIDELGSLAAAFTGVLIGAMICLWAAKEGRRALGNAFARWPERHSAVPALLAIFTLLAVAFLAWRPEVWWTEIRVNALGALLLALGVTLWVAVPVTWLILHSLHVRAHAVGSDADDIRAR